MLYQRLGEIADDRPEAVALRTADGQELTYAGLRELVDRTAGGLHRAGVRQGQVVACSLSNSAGYVALIWAVARLGATYVPMIREFGPEDIAAALELTRPALVVEDGTRPPLAGASVPAVPLAELGRAEPLPPEALSTQRGPFRLLWSSGSTGLPKMISWRQDKFLAERRRWNRHIGITEDDVFFCRHPLDVAHATDLHLFSAQLSGACCVLADSRAAPAALARQLADSGASVISALPGHYEELVRTARELGELDLSRLRLPLCGGTYVSSQVIRDCAEELGIRVRQLYGSTEFGLAAVNLSDTVQTGAEVSLVDGVRARLEPLAPQDPDVGELVLRSEFTSEGYLNNDAAHARTFRAGEYFSGDIARRTADGSYRVIGRTNEVLAAAGGPLLAPMLDAEIKRDCRVTESVSLPSDPERYGQEVSVIVESGPGRDDAALAASVRAVLDRHGLTGDIHCVPAIARTAVGKPHKSLLRARLARPAAAPRTPLDPPPASEGDLLHYTRHSARPTLLLVPGLGMTARYFDPVVAGLRADHDIVTVDLRGHGASPEPPPGWALKDAAADLRQVIERLGLRDVTLLGWSLGAAVAYTYLDTYGTDRVGKLVSVEMSPRLLAEEGDGAQQRWEHAAFGNLDAAGALRAAHTQWTDPHTYLETLVRACFAAGSEPAPEVLRPLLEESLGCSRTALLALWTDVLAQDWRPRLHTLTLPTLLVHGARSQVFPTDVGKWLLGALPDARLEMFSHSGHVPFIEEPEKFVSVLRRFVDE